MNQPFEVVTPEAVEINYRIAGLGSRFLATLLDTFCIVCYMGALIYGAVVASIVGDAIGGSGLGSLAIVLLILGSFLLIWGYYILLETFWSGQTIGKRAFKLRVVKNNGSPIGFMDSFVRNIVRFVDFLPAFYGVGAVSIFVSKESKRLGDYAAGTIVIREKVAVKLDDLAPLSVPPTTQDPGSGFTDPDELNWNVRALEPAQLEVVRTYMQRAPELPADARSRLANELVAQVCSTIGAREPLDPDLFLRRVLAVRDHEG